jgi:hypothetical protein
LQCDRIIVPTGAFRGHRDTDIAAHRPALAVGEFIQRFLRVEQDYFAVLRDAERQSEGGGRYAVIAHGLPMDAQHAFAIFARDTNAALRDARENEFAGRIGFQSFVRRVHAVKMMQCFVHAHVDLVLGRGNGRGTRENSDHCAAGDCI